MVDPAQALPKFGGNVGHGAAGLGEHVQHAEHGTLGSLHAQVVSPYAHATLPEQTSPAFGMAPGHVPCVAHVPLAV